MAQLVIPQVPSEKRYGLSGDEIEPGVRNGQIGVLGMPEEVAEAAADIEDRIA